MFNSSKSCLRLPNPTSISLQTVLFVAFVMSLVAPHFSFFWCLREIHGRLCFVIVVFPGYLHMFEPAHDKTYKTCETSEDSNQPVHPLSVTTVSVYCSLYSPEAVKGTCDQQRL